MTTTLLSRCDEHHSNRVLTPILPATLLFGAAQFTTPTCVLITSPFIIGLRYYRWNRQPVSFPIDGDKCEVSGTHMLTLIFDVVLHPHLHADLHRGAERAIHRRTQDDKVPH